MNGADSLKDRPHWLNQRRGGRVNGSTRRLRIRQSRQARSLLAGASVFVIAWLAAPDVRAAESAALIDDFEADIERALDTINTSAAAREERARQRAENRVLGAARRAALATMGDEPTPEALAFGRSQAAKDPGNFALRLKLAKLLAGAGNLPEAEAVARALLADPATASLPIVRQRTTLRLASLALARGDTAGARAILAGLEDLAPTQAERARAAQLEARIAAREEAEEATGALSAIGTRPTANALAEARRYHDANPSQTAFSLGYANLLAQGLRFEEAAAVYQGVIDGPGDGETKQQARLGLANVYLRSNRPQEAQRVIEVVETTAGEGALPERVMTLRGRLAERLDANQWRGELRAAVGYDTDARTRSTVIDDDRAVVLLDDQGSAFETLNAEGEYRRVIDRRGNVLAVRAEAEQTWYNSVGDIDRTTLEASAGPVFDLPGRPTRLSASVGYRYRLRDYDFSRATAYALVTAEHRISYVVRLKGSYRFERNADSDDNRDGIAHEIVAELRYDLSERDRLTVLGRGRLETARAGFESRRIVGGGLAYRHEFDLPRFPRLYVELAGLVGQSAYRVASGRPEDQGLTRRDLDWRVDFVVGKMLTDLWRAEIQASYIERASNINRNDRNSVRVLLNVVRALE